MTRRARLAMDARAPDPLARSLAAAQLLTYSAFSDARLTLTLILIVMTGSTPHTMHSRNLRS